MRTFRRLLNPVSTSATRLWCHSALRRRLLGLSSANARMSWASGAAGTPKLSMARCALCNSHTTCKLQRAAGAAQLAPTGQPGNRGPAELRHVVVPGALDVDQCHRKQ
jgi:hypothetical protein